MTSPPPLDDVHRHLDRGESVQAAHLLRRHLDAHPDDVRALRLLAEFEGTRGELAEARHLLERALAVDPEDPETLRDLGVVLTRHREPGPALVHLQRALRHAPDDPFAWRALAAVFGGVRSLARFPVDVAERLTLLCLRSGAFDPGDVRTFLPLLLRELPVWGSLLEAVERGEGDAFLDSATGIWASLARPVVVEALPQLVVPDLAVEGALGGLRRHLGRELWGGGGDEAAAHLAFLAALARNHFETGYVQAYDDDERRAVEGVVAGLAGRRLGSDPLDAARVALIAAYLPLLEWERAGEVLERVEAGWAPELAGLVVQQILEPLREAELAREIPSRGIADDEVSRQVRALYEAHPYPRWRALAPIRSRPVARRLHLLFPWRTATPADRIADPRILVAGCGSGYQPLAVARQFDGAHVVALDLSLASLAYARRKAEEAGIDAVDFVHADILELDDWQEEAFDIVASTGVLHHLADPEAGWAQLVRRLRPGGFMKIALYAARAREGVARARELLKELGDDVHPDDIPDLRARLTGALVATDWGRRVTAFQDYYSLHEFRDLLMHPHEDPFTLPRIRRALDDLGLHFIGFEGVHADHLRRFGETEGGRWGDLEAWARFEAREPDVFSGMYQFWVHRPA